MNKELMISKINQTSEKLHSIWNNIKLNQMEKVKESWEDSVCGEYINEVNKVDGIINQIIDRLEECKEFWEITKEDAK